MGRTQGLTGRRRNARTSEPVAEGRAVRCSCGFGIRGSEKFIAEQIAALHGTCPSCGGRWINYGRKGEAEVRIEDEVPEEEPGTETLVSTVVDGEDGE